MENDMSKKEKEMRKIKLLSELSGIETELKSKKNSINSGMFDDSSINELETKIEMIKKIINN